MKWFRRTTSFERNGHFNIHTPVFNTRFSAWFFFLWLGWGWSSFQVSSYNMVNQQDGREL